MAGSGEDVGHTPGRVAKVDLFWTVEGVKTTDEERAEVVCACA